MQHTVQCVCVCYILLCVTVLCNSEYLSDVTVHTKSGIVRGRQKRENYDLGPEKITDTVDEFWGIPYAAPPIGENRFQPPQPHPGWSGTRNASVPSPVCPQIVYYSQTAEIYQSEDCLYLNVWRPAAAQAGASAAGYPVMVFVHGGSYEEGSGDRYNGFVLAQYGVVVVTINYRLGVLGYLSSGDSHLPGNYGLRDQIASLRWVKDNIRGFHGNPSDVTIYGSSAGASSVGLMLVCPLAKGLFHKVIMQSGVPISFWSVYNDTVDLQHFVHQIADRLHCRDDTLDARIQCLREVNYTRFTDLHWKFPRIVPSDLNFKPVVDGDVLRAQPIDLFTRGDYAKVPVITGVVQEEWARSMGWFYKDLENTGIDKDYNDGFDRLSFEQSINHVVQERFWWPPEVSDVIIHEYTNWRHLDDAQHNRDNYIHFMSDLAMVAPTVRLSKLLAVGGHPGTTGNPAAPPEVFVYKFNHRSIHTDPPWWGCYHSLELDSVFGSPYLGYDIATDQPQNHTQADKHISTIVMRLWTNFAKYGNPTPSGVSPDLTTWNPFTLNHQQYLSLTTSHVTVKSHMRAEKVAFWSRLVPQLVRKIQQRDPGEDYLYPYRISLWFLLPVTLLCTMIITVLAFMLLVQSKKRNELERSNGRTLITADTNCGSHANSTSTAKPQMI